MFYIFKKDGTFNCTCNTNEADMGDDFFVVESEKHFDNPFLKNGEIIELGAMPSPFHTINIGKGEWELTAESQSKKQAFDKAKELAEAKRKFEELSRQIATLERKQKAGRATKDDLKRLDEVIIEAEKLEGFIYS